MTTLRRKLDGEKHVTPLRDPIDVLYSAARYFHTIYGEQGARIAAYVAAHALNGTKEWPRTGEYYKRAAEGYRPDGDTADLFGGGDYIGLDGQIFPFMLENAFDRLTNAIINHTTYDPQSVIPELEEIASGKRTTLYPKPVRCGCGETLPSTLALSKHVSGEPTHGRAVRRTDGGPRGVSE